MRTISYIYLRGQQCVLPVTIEMVHKVIIAVENIVREVPVKDEPITAPVYTHATW